MLLPYFSYVTLFSYIRCLCLKTNIFAQLAPKQRELKRFRPRRGTWFTTFKHCLRQSFRPTSSRALSI